MFYIKLLKLNSCQYDYVFLLFILWDVDFSSSWKHLLITLLKLQFVVLVFYFSVYNHFCNFN